MIYQRLSFHTAIVLYERNLCEYYIVILKVTGVLLSSTEFLPGHASLPLDLSKKIPNGQHKLSITQGHGLAPTAVVILEVSDIFLTSMLVCKY